MLKNSVCVSEEKIVEKSTFSYVYVDDPETMPIEDDPSGTTVYFPVGVRDGLVETMREHSGIEKKCRFAVVQINSDGFCVMIVRGEDRRSVVQDAAVLVFGVFGIFLNTNILLETSKYECDGIVWRVLPYEFNLIQSI